MSTVNRCERARSAAVRPCLPLNTMPSRTIRSTLVIVAIRFAPSADARHRLARGDAESGLVVRPAASEDLGSLNDVYNEYVVQSHATFDVEPTTTDWRQEWFAHHGYTGRYRVMVAVADGRVIGYASSSRFRPKPAYETSIEVSVYVAGEAVGRGVGSQVYKSLFAALRG